MHVPALIGDYTDFYVGIHHATNVGRLFRPDNPLLPNYKYVPIGYHGRASSVRPSGETVIRPSGQRKAPDADAPEYGPSRRLDYELELGLWIGRGNELGTADPDRRGGRAYRWILPAQRLVGARHPGMGISAARAVPGQEFPDQRSPWIVTLDALAPFRTAMPPRPKGDPQPLPYLDDDADRRQRRLDIQLEVMLSTEKMRAAGLAPHILSHGSADAAMYWSAAQIVAHHASNGCNLQPGDLIGTGTLSTDSDDGLGSLLEISRAASSRSSFRAARRAASSRTATR